MSYSSDIQDFLNWFVNTYGKLFDGKVLEQDTREYRNYLLNILKQKPATINRKLAALKGFNQFLVKEGTGTDIPIFGISIADTDDRDIKTIERNSLNRLKRAVYASENKRDIALLELLVNTGVRVSELVSLTVEDIHLTERNGSQNHSLVIIRQGKNGKYREIPLNAQSKNAIEQYLAVRNSSSPKVFIGERGPLRRETVDKILKKHCVQAGIEGISAHVLRHTFCSRLMSENVPIPIIQKLAGHSSLNVTMNFYVNVSRADKVAAVEKL